MSVSYERIVWSKDHFLSWNDFQGTPVLGADYKVKSSIRIKYGYCYDFVGKSEFKFTKLNVVTYFYPKESWVKPKFRNDSKEFQDQILHHEQGHFDLAEEYTRKIQPKLISKFVSKTFTFKTDGKDMEKDADAEAIKIIDLCFTELMKEYEKESEVYEEETYHGTISEKQHHYNKRFANLRG